MPKQGAVVPAEQIERAILLIRDHRVMLDADLAVLYGVPTKRLAEQVRRNSRRFPADFMFRLTAVEARILRSRIATSSFGRGWGGRRYAPYAFTEQGVASSPASSEARVPSRSISPSCEPSYGFAGCLPRVKRSPASSTRSKENTTLDSKPSSMPFDNSCHRQPPGVARSAFARGPGGTT